MTNESCKSVNELLVEYSDGELPAEAMRRIAAHLAECADCRAELRLLTRSLDLARAVWQEAAAQVSADGPLPARPGGGWLRPAACLAAGVALVAVTAAAWLALYGRPHGGAQPDRVAQTQRPDAAGLAEDVDIGAFIARQGRAARLAAAAELLATQPALKPYQDQAERYLAEAYGDTPAGQAAAQRLAAPN